MEAIAAARTLRWPRLPPAQADGMRLLAIHKVAGDNHSAILRRPSDQSIGCLLWFHGGAYFIREIFYLRCLRHNQSNEIKYN